jgi:DNA-binding transcriptional MocR family regulator
VRVGYLAGPPDEIKDLATRGSEHYISPNMLAESVVLELCTSGELERNIEFVNTALRERRDALVEALREYIPEAEFVVPEGGYFLWLTVGEDVDCAELKAAVQEEGVTFVPGCDFMLEGGDNALRLSFAPVPTEQISEGVQRIARGLERMRTTAAA